MDTDVDATEEAPLEDFHPFTVTFKSGKGYEDTWVTVRGRSPKHLKQHIGTAFDIDGWEQMTLVEVISEATSLFHAIGNVGRGAGGRVVSRGRASAKDARDRADSSGGDPWAQAEAAQAEADETPAEPVDPNKALLDEIEATEDTLVLKQFWVKHNPLNEVIEAAWRAKGKALKEKESK